MTYQISSFHSSGVALPVNIRSVTHNTRLAAPHVVLQPHTSSGTRFVGGLGSSPFYLYCSCKRVRQSTLSCTWSDVRVIKTIPNVIYNFYVVEAYKNFSWNFFLLLYTLLYFHHFVSWVSKILKHAFNSRNWFQPSCKSNYFWYIAAAYHAFWFLEVDVA